MRTGATEITSRSSTRNGLDHLNASGGRDRDHINVPRSPVASGASLPTRGPHGSHGGGRARREDLDVPVVDNSRRCAREARPRPSPHDAYPEARMSPDLTTRPSID